MKISWCARDDTASVAVARVEIVRRGVMATVMTPGSGGGWEQATASSRDRARTRSREGFSPHPTEEPSSTPFSRVSLQLLLQLGQQRQRLQGRQIVVSSSRKPLRELLGGRIAADAI